jgi:PKD repeat protein
MIPKPVSASFTSSISILAGPFSIYVGQWTSLSFDIQNGDATKAMTITDVTAGFSDWDSVPTHLIIPSNPIASGGYAIIYHNFTVPVDATIGSHTLQLTIIGKMSDEASTTTINDPMQYTVKNVPSLDVVCSANPSTGSTPLYVSFTSTVTGGLEPLTFSWTFGDGGTSTYQNPQHNYLASGTYTVTVTVTDSKTNHQVASDTATVTVVGGGVSDIFGSLGGMMMIGGLIIVIIIVVIVVSIISKRSKSGGKGQSPPTQQFNSPENPAINQAPLSLQRPAQVYQQPIPPPPYQASQNQRPLFCPNCGKPSEGQFCKNCGTKLN